jgi:hypothetical protein
MMDDDSISDMQSPTSQRWSYFLGNAASCPTWWRNVYHLPRSATNLEAELDCTICTIQLWGEIDMPYRYLSSLITWHPTSCGIIFCFAFYILFCKEGLKMMGSDKIRTASCTYVHVLFLCHLYPLPFTWRITNENFQKILFSCNSSHNFTPKRNELWYRCCCFSQLYFIGH